MPSRRGGRKSHHGCQNCKARHLKCDEDFPTCGRCKKRNETCIRSYSPFRSAPTTPTIPQHVSSATTEHSWHNIVAYHPEGQPVLSTVSQDGKDQIPSVGESQFTTLVLPDICSRLVTTPSPDADTSQQGDWLDDMLFKHYKAVVCWTLNEHKVVVDVFRHLVPEVAARHASLRHALLTISGAHCVATLFAPAQTQPPRVISTLMDRTLHHHTCTLNLFAKQISKAQHAATLSQDDCVAMTLVSIFVLTSFLSQLQPAFLESAPPGSPGAIDRSVAMLNLLGPITTFFQEYHEQIANSELRVFMGDYLRTVEADAALVPREVEQGLIAVATLCQATPDVQLRELYAAVVQGLLLLYRHVAMDPRTVGGRFGWVNGNNAISMANCVYRRRPEALILLAFWAASLIPWPQWYGVEFAASVITEVDQMLPPGYESYLIWPRSRLV